MLFSVSVPVLSVNRYSTCRWYENGGGDVKSDERFSAGGWGMVGSFLFLYKKKIFDFMKFRMIP